MTGYRFVTVEGDPYNCGYQHGVQARDMIQAAARDVFPRFLQAHTGTSMDELLSLAKEFESYIMRHAPQLHEELQGVRDGADITWREALMLQTRPELRRAALLQPLGSNGDGTDQECTSFAAVGGLTETGEVLVAQNIDMDPLLEDLGVILLIRPTHGPTVLTWTIAGVLGQTGVNSAGLARCGNVLFSGDWRVAVPTSILFRLVLDAEDLDAVRDICSRIPRAKSNNFLCAEASGDIANFELTVDETEIIGANNGLILHTNHYCHPRFLGTESNPKLANSKIRYGRLQELVQSTVALGAGERALSVAVAEEMLADHSAGPDSICAHGHRGTKTIASCVLEPASGRMHITKGNPCENEYETFSIFDA